MAQHKILVDTNAYLRLAQSLHPLLNNPFGRKHYCLYVLPELEGEYFKNPRLRTSFSWVEQEEYRENRKAKWYLSREQRVSIQRSYEFILMESYETKSTASRVDILCLAYGFALGIPVVTDDPGMVDLGKRFAITIWSTFDLLNLMLIEKKVTMEKIREIAAYLRYMKELPRRLIDIYVRLFGEQPP